MDSYPPHRRRLRVALAIAFGFALVSRSLNAANDGNQIEITTNQAKEFVWADDDGFEWWNIYTGDLQVLRDTGVYTQALGSSPLAWRQCDRGGQRFSIVGDPAPGECAFALLSGDRGDRESGLGTDGGGNMRFNSWPCHPFDDPPDPPGAPTLVAGHCGGFWTSWTPSASGNVTGYLVRSGTTPGSPTKSKASASTEIFADGLSTGTSYYVSVAALDASGNQSWPSPETLATTSNTTTPRSPVSLEATRSPYSNSVYVSWPPVTSNEENVQGDPASPQIRDLAGYRVYRSSSTGFPVDAAHRVADTSSSPGGPAAIYDSIVGCRHYAYAVTAVDTCGVESAASPEAEVTALNMAPSQPPTNLQAFKVFATNELHWYSPTEDVHGQPIAVDSYRVERTPPTPRTTPISELQFAPLQDVVEAAPTFVDTNPPLLQEDETIYYRVRAFDDCPNVSDPSNVAEPTCAFSGTVDFPSLVDGAQVAGVSPIVVAVSGGTDTYTGVTIRYTHDTSGVTRTFASSTPGSSWVDFQWLAWPLGGYTIQATVTNSAGCTQRRSIHVTAGDTVACCLDLYPTTTTIVACAGGATKCKEVSHRIGNDHCGTAVGLESMSVDWTDYSGNKPHWMTARFNAVNIAPVGSWTTTYDGQSPEHGTAGKADFGTPYIVVPYAVPMSTANTTNVTYVFDTFTDSGSGSLRKVDVFTSNTYSFVLLDSAGSPTGSTPLATFRP